MEFAEKMEAGKTAVVVIDMQRDYFCRGGIVDRMGDDCEALQSIVQPLADFLEHVRPIVRMVIFTRQTANPVLRSAVAIEHYTRAGMARPFDPAMEDFFGVAPCDTDVVLPKSKYSAFVGTPLDLMLRANGVRTLVLTGVATNVCVESTARDGFMRDYHIVVASDLTAGASDAAKQASLRNLGTYFGEVIDSTLIRSVWDDRMPRSDVPGESCA